MLPQQTVVGLEQLTMANVYPEVIVGCTGGGSNFSGIAFPFIGAGLRGGRKPRIVAIEPAACPSLTRGRYAYDYGDTGHMTPLAKMHTLGGCFSAGVLFARHEGIVPAPEANHAVKGAIEEALRCKREKGRAEVILFNLCGHGHFDMAAYSDYFAGKLKDLTYSEDELAMALSGLPSVSEVPD